MCHTNIWIEIVLLLLNGLFEVSPILLIIPHKLFLQILFRFKLFLNFFRPLFVFLSSIFLFLSEGYYVLDVGYLHVNEGPETLEEAEVFALEAPYVGILWALNVSKYLKHL